jgi:hypothetical protein
VNLQDRWRKAVQKQNKFLRPKYGSTQFDNLLVNDNFDQKMTALQAQNDKMRRRLGTLVAARDYERFQLGNDPELWWWYFMESAPPRCYMPSLFGYYQRRPDVVVMMDAEDAWLEREREDAAARAFVAADAAESTGYLS